MIIIPPPYEWTKKTSQRVESFILGKKSKQNLIVGASLVLFSSLLFLFTPFKIDPYVSSNGFQIIFEDHLRLASIYLALHALILISLLNASSDRFRYPTVLSVVILLMFFPLFLMEIPLRFPYAAKEGAIGPLNVLQPILPVVFLSIFGLEATKMPPKAPWFKWSAKVNARMQREYDQGVVEQDILDRLGKSKSKTADIKQILFFTQAVILAIALFLLLFQLEWQEIFIAVALAETGAMVILGYILLNMKKFSRKRKWGI